jgi:hypothetical protein
VIKAEQDLPRTEVGRWERVGEGGEMTQTMYAHVNKRINKTKQNKTKQKAHAKHLQQKYKQLNPRGSNHQCVLNLPDSGSCKEWGKSNALMDYGNKATTPYYLEVRIH